MFRCSRSVRSICRFASVFVVGRHCPMTLQGPCQPAVIRSKTESPAAFRSAQRYNSSIAGMTRRYACRCVCPDRFRSGPAHFSGSRNYFTARWTARPSTVGNLRQYSIASARWTACEQAGFDPCDRIPATPARVLQSDRISMRRRRCCACLGNTSSSTPLRTSARMLSASTSRPSRNCR